MNESGKISINIKICLKMKKRIISILLYPKEPKKFEREVSITINLTDF